MRNNACADRARAGGYEGRTFRDNEYTPAENFRRGKCETGEIGSIKGFLKRESSRNGNSGCDRPPPVPYFFARLNS